MKEIVRASLLIFILGSGCNLPVSPAPTIARDRITTIVASQLTEVYLNTVSAPRTPTSSPMPIRTEELVPTSTQVITPSAIRHQVDFSGHQVYVSYLEGDVLQVSITVPNGIKGDYTAVFGEKVFRCFTYTSKNLDRLICHGPILKSELSYPFRVFTSGNELPIFERFVTVPVPPT
jgi:hypothetical protein